MWCTAVEKGKEILKSYIPVYPDSMVISLRDIAGTDARSIAGGKGASLAQMTSAGLPVPAGFVVGTEALRLFLAGEGRNVIYGLLGGLNVHDAEKLSAASKLICDWMAARPIPESLKARIAVAYDELANASGGARVAVRSSGASEDGEAASFAGQQETFLNVCGTDAVVSKIVECWMSFFSPRAIFYRGQKGSLAEISMAVVVQAMVQAEKSGVMFTVDPIRKNPDHMIIEAVYGLGEGIVSGAITPDHCVIHRSLDCVVQEVIAEKLVQIAWDDCESANVEHPVPAEKRGTAVLTKNELMRLRDLGLKLERHFGRPQDVEWCSRSEQLFLLQSRPITTL